MAADSGPDEATIRKIVRDELRDPSLTRRDALKGVIIGGLAGGAGGIGTASAQASLQGSGQLDVGSVTTNTYRIAGNRYGGPDSAKTELDSELGSGDTGAKYIAEDTGAEYHWTGTAWDKLPGEFPKLNGADLAAAASGEVPKSDGSGGLTMGTAGSGSAITAQEDGSDLTTDMTLLNAADGVTATNPTGNEIEVFTQSVTTQTGSYTASEQDVVLADASSSALTVTLPSPTTDVDVKVKKIDSSANGVTIATPSTETIDGDSSRTITAQYVSREIVSDGTDYFIV